jgi:hypothetical protein
LRCHSITTWLQTEIRVSSSKPENLMVLHLMDSEFRKFVNGEVAVRGATECILPSLLLDRRGTLWCSGNHAELQLYIQKERGSDRRITRYSDLNSFIIHLLASSDDC